MTAPAGALLALDDATIWRGGRLVLDGLTLAVQAGETIWLQGPNGVGKSTALRALAGLLPLRSGRRHAPTAPGLADEQPALDEERELAAALRWWADGHDAAGAVARALEAVALDQLADVPVRMLSTGQRRRATLARLLVQNRRVWLLDEPGNGLDAAALDRLGAIVVSHCAAGGAVVLASHFALPSVSASALPLHAPRLAA